MTDDEIIRVQAGCVVMLSKTALSKSDYATLGAACDAIRDLRREIKSLRERLARQALHLERAELDAETMRRVAFGGQKGGAA